MDNSQRKRGIKEKILTLIMMFLGNHLNYYTSYLGEPKNTLVSLVFNYFAPRVSIPKEDKKTIRELSKKGTIIYAQKNRSSLDFLFFQHRYYIEGLPYPVFGNFINMIWWQSITSAARILLSKLYCFIEGIESPNPYHTDYVRRMSQEGHSSILFLRHPTGLLKRFALKETDDPVVYLLRAQKVMDRTIYIIPHIIIYHKRPDTARKGIFDVLFGPREGPGLLRRIIVFLANYRRAFVKIGDPINLKDFLAQKHDVVDGEVSYDLRRMLLDNIEREERLIKGPILKSRLEIMEMVLWDDEFQKRVQNISEVTREPIRALRRRAVTYLDEIAADYNIFYIQVFDAVVSWMWNNIFNGFDIDQEGLNKVREAAKKSSLVIMPCHKSHVDYLVLSQVFLHNNLTPPHIAAGINLSFFPLGHIFRKSGAFFLKRTFRGDPLYPIVFSTYVKTILSEGFSVEFFIEGGRSRTGKLVMPKLGLLSIITDAYLSGAVEDISFVPIFIGYDRIVEESSYISEMGGAVKKKETLWSLIKSRSLLKKRYGRVYIAFNDPISLKGLIEATGYNRETIPKSQMDQLQYDLAYRVVYSINQISVVSTVNLVSAAFLASPQGALTHDELIQICRIFMGWLSSFRIRFSNVLNNPSAAINEALNTLREENLIQEIKGESDEPDFEKVFFVPEEKRLTLEFYKNNILHFFIPASFVATSILSGESGGTTYDQIIADYTYVRKLFKYEFIYDLEFTDEQRVNQALDYFTRHGYIDRDNGVITVAETGWDILLYFSELIRNYIESYLVTSEALQNYITRGLRSERDLLKRINVTGQRMLKKKEITRIEALSRMNFQNAIELLTHENVLSKFTEDEGKRPVKYYAPGPVANSFTDKIKRYLTRTGG
ncbi:MAG: 1-acyl-sn-glycerol-3-phosphate acyltransferase [Deltaproteobacteria bacterium]|nr:1-acyl-sn-glycerol-3-phosphate acyltransferase [Candidatus Zymogenaceae bacterium]